MTSLVTQRRKQDKGGGSGKYHRNEIDCKIYRNEKKREKSHIKRIEKHLTKHIKDRQAKEALVRFKKLLES